jgi:hypothetical protein
MMKSIDAGRWFPSNLERMGVPDDVFLTHQVLRDLDQVS